MAVDRRDHRHFGFHQRPGDPLHATPVIGARGIRLVERPDAAAILHALEIAARTKGAAIAGQDRHADAGIVADRLDRGDEIVAILPLADRVQRLGLVHAQDRNAPLPLDLDEIAHSLSLKQPYVRRKAGSPRDWRHRKTDILRYVGITTRTAANPAEMTVPLPCAFVTGCI